MKEYIVVRIRFAGESEVHSVEYRDTYHEALQRMSAVFSADINNAETNYNAAYIFNSNGTCYKQEINDLVQMEGTLFTVVRFFEKNGSMSNSVQHYFVDPEHPSKAYNTALQRWFNIIAADLLDEAITFNGAMLIDGNGNAMESRTFDRTEEDE